MNEEKLEKLKESAKDFYKNIGEVYSPYFKEKISFNSKGFEHLEFKRNKIKRVFSDQYKRYKIIKYAPIIIQSSHTLQGRRYGRSFEYIKINSRWEYVLKNVCYFEFIAVLDDFRLRVVIKQIENGDKYFWSIIPFWKIDKDNYKIIHSGIDDAD